ncbi:glutathione S-transferase, alpha tandem duplicate 1 [Polyodon spathula]|uniref:glutathione S-transferase, alpha tandem duplicate 1 n=1 Tax=Polyodon spathula TaxID=7913 RepID=UPI001B7E32C6|nr:glutathione S-transferase, alpha tandem duplicate 1 [Polyodon spathula]XP_041106074.1 glutathione S-transferase, alpha tandem duplicate 1 [Polyodon spathula]
MAEKAKLYYFDGRGLMESIRWLLTVAGVEFEEVFLKTREQYEQLLKDGALMFQQVPLVEIDGMKLVQTKAILSYIAAKYNLYGKDLKERVMIDMYVEGIRDLMELIVKHPFLPPAEKESNTKLIQTKAIDRYFPVYEKALARSGGGYLVGSQLSQADVQVFEVVLMVEEKFPSVLSNFPQLEAFQTRMKSVPAIQKFLQPGSQRKPQPDDNYVKTAREVLRF